MDFADGVAEHAKRVASLKGTLLTEEAAKTALIMPFFAQLLGYDVFNPNEFIPEFTADFAAKKGERVDYAIKIDDKVTILVETKGCGEKLDNHGTQLFHYYNSTPARFGILTNGIVYRFYTDLTKDNLMDDEPFLIFDFEHYTDRDITELKKFHKEKFSVDGILSTASRLKYLSAMESVFESFGKEPDDDFVKYVLSKIYDGVKTQAVIDKFRQLIKTGYNDYINELMSGRITTALKSNEVTDPAPTPANTDDECGECDPGIETTEREMEAFYSIRTMLGTITARENVTYKDTRAYFSINYKHNSWKWICRIQFRTQDILLTLPDEDKKSLTFHLKTLDDLIEYKEQLVTVTRRYLSD